MPIMAAGFIYVAITEPSLMFTIGSIVVVIGTLAFPFKFIRRVRFGRKLVIDRFILPPREIDYSDITDIGITGVKTRHGNISLYEMTNANEFKDLLVTALAHAEISDGQLEGKLAQQEVNAAKDSVYAGFLSFALFILLVWLKPPWLRYFNGDNLFLLPLALFTACYFVLLLARKWQVREMETKT